MMRKSLRKPSGRKAASQRSEPLKQIHVGLSFHFWVDVMSVIASFATVAALIAAAVTLRWLYHDRTDQANVAAWTLLQNYLQSEPRAQSDEGQSFALETLVKNGVAIVGIDAQHIWLSNADLSEAKAVLADFRHAYFGYVNFTNAVFGAANFEDTMFLACNCVNASFEEANLSGLIVLSGDFSHANFKLADVSDLQIARGEQLIFDSSRLAYIQKPDPAKIDANAFEDACYEAGHEPQFLGSVKRPMDPQGDACKRQWGDAWAARGKQAAPSTEQSNDKRG
jgi:hypothetical protein